MIYVVDFFCGAGGASLGFNKAGANILLGIDHKPIYKETFEQIRNLSGIKAQFLEADIFPATDTHPEGQLHIVEDKINEVLKSVSFGGKRDYLIFIVCAPCQPFSTMKSKLSKKTETQRERDKALLVSTLSLAKKFSPDAIFMENVAGIDKCDENGISALGTAFDYLERLNYTCATKLVNACNFGVAQSRFRQISLATASKHTSIKELPEKDDELDQRLTVKDVLSKYPVLISGEKHPSIPNHITRDLTAINLQRLSSVKPGESNRVFADSDYGDISLKCHRDLAEKNNGVSSYGDTYTRMDPDGLSPTITTNCISVSNGRFGHYDTKQIRGISVREAAALQSFPDDFIFYPVHSLQPAATMVGNAVPPKLSEYYANYLFRSLDII